MYLKVLHNLKEPFSSGNEDYNIWLKLKENFNCSSWTIAKTLALAHLDNIHIMFLEKYILVRKQIIHFLKINEGNGEILGNESIE